MKPTENLLRIYTLRHRKDKIMPYSTVIVLAIFLAYLGFETIQYLVKKEHAGEHLNIHINLFGECDFITYKGRKYYPCKKGGVFRNVRH